MFDLCKKLLLRQGDLNAILIIDDGFGSLSYTTDLLKNGGFASIGPSNDKNTEMGTFALLPKHPDMVCICCNESIGSLDKNFGLPAWDASAPIFIGDR